MPNYSQVARDLYRRYVAATVRPRSEALRALDLKTEHVNAAFAPIARERREAFQRFQAEMRAVVASAREHMHLSAPDAVDRSLVMAKAERQQSAAATRTLLASAPAAELQAVADDAGRRADPATAYALRAILSARVDLTPDQKAPILAALAKPHAESYESAVRDMLGVQIVAHQAETGGPAALPNAARMLDLTRTAGAYYDALRVETPTGPRSFTEHEVLAIFPVDAITPPKDATPDGDFRPLLDALRQSENGAVLNLAHRPEMAAA